MNTKLTNLAARAAATFKFRQALKSVVNEYPIRDQFKLLKGRDVKLHFRSADRPLDPAIFLRYSPKKSFVFFEVFFNQC